MTEETAVQGEGALDQSTRAPQAATPAAEFLNDGLDEMIGVGTKVRFAGRDYWITEFKIHQLPTVASHLFEFGLAFSEISNNDTAMIVALATRNPEPFFHICSLALGTNIETFRQGKGSEFIGVVKAIWKENELFFRQAAELVGAMAPTETTTSGTTQDPPPTPEAPMTGSI